MLKRIAGLVIFIALAAFPTIIYAQDDYCWVEAEDAVLNNGFEFVDNDYASNKKLATIYQTVPGEYELDLEFNIPNKGEYDIWVLSCTGTSTAVSKFKWRVNDNEPKQYSSTGEVNNIVYKNSIQIEIGSIQQQIEQNIQWNRVAQGGILNKGRNTFSYIIDTKSVTGTRSYISMIDCLVIVPSDYEWQPGTDINRPEAPPRDFAWIEMEEFKNEGTSFREVLAPDASGGAMLYAYNIVNETGEEYFDYSFFVDSDGDYDLWYLGCETDAAATHLSGMWWNIDEKVDISDDKQRNNTPKGNNITIMNSAGEDTSIPIYWQKLGTKNLESGEHTLNIAYAYRTLAGAEGAFVTWADCIVVIPAEYGWVPPQDETAVDKIPCYDKARLDGKYIKKEYFSGDYSKVLENITLPQNPMTPGGSKVSFSSESDVMDDAGNVTRPYFTGNDTEFNFNIVTNYESAEVNTPVQMTVLKYPKYSVSEFGIYDESGKTADTLNKNMTYTAKAGVKINAAPDSAEKGSAVIIMALYDEKGALKAISMGLEKVTMEETIVETSLDTGEEDGRVLKVYLLNNFTLANQLSNTIELTP